MCKIKSTLSSKTLIPGSNKTSSLRLDYKRHPSCKYKNKDGDFIMNKNFGDEKFRFFGK
jgi:hypothetical protein